jgi:CDP-paratose 2-epimerase
MAVYNVVGGRESDISMLEAIELCQEIAGRDLGYELSDEPRIGDHRWYVSDMSSFVADYPGWRLSLAIEQVLRQIHDLNREQ